MARTNCCVPSEVLRAWRPLDIRWVQIAAPSHLHHDRRIVVYVVTGSGKSTPAARLAALTGILHVAVDDLMWRPGWVQVEARQQVEALRPAVSRPE